MREILFRGKDYSGVINHSWCIGSLDTTQKENPIIIYPDRFGNSCRIFVDPETVGQYTGLTDKNGKKIFEGDILKVKTMWHAEFHEDNNGFFSAPIKKETYWSVEYKNFCGKMGFMVYGIDRRWHTNLTWNKLYNSEAVVVGNIYDNPELMKKKEGDKNDLRKMHT